MVWRLQYTSAESGPTGRSGFQFVATSPDVPPEVVRAATPYMTYRPPPDAPSAPSPQELARFPTALAYGREGPHAVVARCHYTGRDYSGRQGNFFGHAVVATPEEMEGLRPIELWDSPLWDTPVAAGGIEPGSAFDPESLIDWLAGENGHDRLAALLDTITAALTGGHGRVVLVSADVELIARWIAVVSYSLPSELAGRMSFTTYTADPEAAPQLVAGTVPSAWAGEGFRLDEPFSERGRAGRFARVVANCWREADLDGIDAVGEPAAEGASPDAAAALLALVRGDPSVSSAEQAEAAAHVRERGAPSWLWPALSAAVPRLTFELASALGQAERCVELALADPGLRLPDGLRLRDGLAGEFRVAAAGAADLNGLTRVVRLADQAGGRLDRADVAGAAAACARRGSGDVARALHEVPRGWREALTSGVLAGLEAAEPHVRRAMLTPEACGVLGDRDWSRAPRTGGLVLTSLGTTASVSRAEATAGLVGLEHHGLPEIDELLAALWAAEPTVAECTGLVRRLGARMGRYAPLRGLIRRVFDGADLGATGTVRLAELIRATLPAQAGPARLVLVHRDALAAGREPEVARILDRLPESGPVDRVWASVAAGLLHRPVTFRLGVLRAASPSVRARLTGSWLALDPDRDERADLAEIAVRLEQTGSPEPALAAWARGLGLLARRHVAAALADRDPALAAGWRDLRRGA